MMKHDSFQGNILLLFIFGTSTPRIILINMSSRLETSQKIWKNIYNRATCEIESAIRNNFPSSFHFELKNIKFVYVTVPWYCRDGSYLQVIECFPKELWRLFSDRFVLEWLLEREFGNWMCMGRNGIIWKKILIIVISNKKKNEWFLFRFVDYPSSRTFVSMDKKVNICKCCNCNMHRWNNSTLLHLQFVFREVVRLNWNWGCRWMVWI